VIGSSEVDGVTIDRGLGDAGALGDHVDGECGVADFIEQLARCDKNRLVGTGTTRTAASPFFVLHLQRRHAAD
jgi:hypothetical protein